MTGQLDECDRTTEMALDILKDMELQETYCRVTSAGVLLARGSFSSGMDLLERQLDFYRQCDAQFFEAQTMLMIGMFYLRIALRSGPRQPGTMKKNFLFLVKNLPVAAKKAERNLSAAAGKLRKMGALSYFGLASLALGRLYLSRKKKDLAREQIVAAVEALETCRARVYLEQAREALASLDQPS